MPSLLLQGVALLGQSLAAAGVAVGINTAISTVAFTIGSLALNALPGLVGLLFRPKGPDIPKPEDGIYNLKQSVPFAPIVLGKAVKGSDYVLLEEQDGVAHHVGVLAYHPIEGVSKTWLHDEVVTLDGSGNVVAPAHFDSKVKLEFRTGAASETAYADPVAAFPAIWSSAHRGDGVASRYMACQSVKAEEYRTVYPNQMPADRNLIEGMSTIVDPRDDTARFTENLALHALECLRASWGFRLSDAQIHMPDFVVAANQADETVLNRDGASEPRWHGGGWFRTDTRPADVLATILYTADFRAYLTADGKVGMHAAGVPETLDTITDADIIAIGFSANRNRDRNVPAVRATYTSALHGYRTVDAALYGDTAALADDPRIRALEFTWAHRHNHAQRRQRDELFRAQAKPVTLVLPWHRGKVLLRKRYARLTCATRGIENALIQIEDRSVDLRQMRVNVQAIILPEAFAEPFVAATMEGVPPPVPEELVREELTPPADFAVEIGESQVSPGLVAPVANTSWTVTPGDKLAETSIYQIEWAYTSAVDVVPIETPQLATTPAGASSFPVGPLRDGAVWAGRIRLVSPGGTVSPWSDWIYEVLLLDPVAPAAPTVTTPAALASGDVSVVIETPSSANVRFAPLHRAPRNWFAASGKVASAIAAPSVPLTLVDGTPPDGTSWYWVTAENGSAVASAAVAAGDVTQNGNNLLPESHDFSAWGVLAGHTAGADDGWLSGASGATKILTRNAQTQHIKQATNALAITSGQSYVVSVLAKAGEVPAFRLYVAGGGQATTGRTFNVSTGTEGVYSGSPTGYGITELPDDPADWYRCWFAFTAGVTGTTSVLIRLGAADFTGNGTDGMFVDHAQVEIGSTPSGIYTRTG